MARSLRWWLQTMVFAATHPMAAASAVHSEAVFAGWVRPRTAEDLLEVARRVVRSEGVERVTITAVRRASSHSPAASASSPGSRAGTGSGPSS